MRTAQNAERALRHRGVIVMRVDGRSSTPAQLDAAAGVLQQLFEGSGEISRISRFK
jgi:hypothetical protein